MSSPAAAAPLATPAKSPKKKPRAQKKNTGPSVSDLILKAVSTYTGRGGMSLAALKKALKAGGYDVVKNRARIVIAIKRLVANKSLVQTKGSGAAGSFKLNKKPPTPRKKKVVKKKKPKTKRVKKAGAKKAAAGASPAAKKSPKKKRKPKSPKKAKKPATAKKTAAAKKPKRVKSPKKVKRKVAKSTRTRAAAKK